MTGDKGTRVEQRHAALNRLLAATDTAIRAGRTLPCLRSYGGPNPWLSDDSAARANAARACDSCPVASECLAYAQAHRTTFGVYGGHDFTIKAVARAVALSSVGDAV
ncbi:WhiB family transcriptional regulator [Micropruina sp.]|uniref:WhiB family transcriptional regulator n=1 Tax=Micropruina sp. TaxID=2737536 RepID=UPI0039E4B141